MKPYVARSFEELVDPQQQLVVFGCDRLEAHPGPATVRTTNEFSKVVNSLALSGEFEPYPRLYRNLVRRVAGGMAIHLVRRQEAVSLGPFVSRCYVAAEHLVSEHRWMRPQGHMLGRYYVSENIGIWPKDQRAYVERTLGRGMNILAAVKLASETELAVAVSDILGAHWSLIPPNGQILA